MKTEVIELGYAMDALEPVISRETMEYHYGKHYQNYVNTLLGLVKDTELASLSLEEIVVRAPEGPVFNNAGQSLNHALYFSQFKAPVAGNAPAGKLAERLIESFGSLEAFKGEFNKAALTLFGSGWAWLSEDKDGKLVISQERNGSNPVRNGLNPLLGVDVWEHAYYLDYRNRRIEHVEALWDIIDWDVVASRLVRK